MLQGMASTAEDVSRLYEHVPADGSPIGNGMLRRLLGWDEGRYELAKIPLVRAVRLRQGPGRSGTLRRSDAIGALVEPGAVDQGGISPTPDVVKAERACQSNVIVGPLAFATGKAPKNPREQPADDAFAAEHQTASVPTVVKEPPSDHPEIEPSRASKSAFTRSGQIVKAIMAMTGMLRSMPSERPLNDDEIAHCHTFVKEHWLLFERSGKAGVLHDFLDAIVDVVLTDAEREHLLASLAQADEAYYDTITRHLQQLHGLLGFAAADRRMEPHEVTALRGWVTDNIELVGTWPYDDIAVLVEDLAKQPTEQAAQALLRYAKSFEGRSLSTSTPVNVDTGESLFTTNPRPICPRILLASPIKTLCLAEYL